MDPTVIPTEEVQSEPEESFDVEPTDVKEEDEEEFGDFTGPEVEEKVVEGNDEEFDDFETAPPPVEADSTSSTSAGGPETPEAQIQRVFVSLFPISDAVTDSVSSSCPSPLKSKITGPLWSYVSQLDSTPALSFTWRHSTSHQNFLQQALRIDSAPQPLVNSIQRGNNFCSIHSLIVLLMGQSSRWGMGGGLNHSWMSPTGTSMTSSFSHNSSNNSLSESFSQHHISDLSANHVSSPPAAQQLDLDFFLNPSSMTTSSTTSNADSLLQSIERELLSSSPAKTAMRPATTISQPPSSTSSVQLGDIFGQLQFVSPPSPSPSRPAAGIDLLQ